ncbi:MAG: hypothetical protein HQK96_18505 [Nitrospirae bacterium]|nr:hypothetical protein [Nitrospirota bacterium]
MLSQLLEYVTSVLRQYLDIDRTRFVEFKRHDGKWVKGRIMKRNDSRGEAYDISDAEDNIHHSISVNDITMMKYHSPVKKEPTR